MVFLDQSSASSIQQHSQEVMKALGQLLALLAELNRLKRDDEEKPPLDHECAETTESLLRSQGTVKPLENGKSSTTLSVGNYELRSDLNDRSGRPTFEVYDLESGEKVMGARRTAKGDYELHEVNKPLSQEQKYGFLCQLQQRSQGVALPGMQGLERTQALVDTLDEQAPRGSKAMLVAESLLGDQLEVSDQQYTYTRGEAGTVSITDTKSDALVAVMSPTGAIDQALSQKDQTYFKQAYERMLLESCQSQAEHVAVSAPESFTVAAEPSSGVPTVAEPVTLTTPQTAAAIAVPVEVVDGEFMEPQGQRRIQARVSQHGQESAGGDLALSVGATLVAQHNGKEYVGERYQVNAYGNGAMTIHATGNPVAVVYANSAGNVTSQLTPEQASQFRQMYQSLSQPQVATPALAAASTIKPRALKPSRSFDLGGR